MKKLIQGLPYLKDLYAQVADYKRKAEALAEELKTYKTWVPPGHFYSPLPDINALSKKENRVFPPTIGEDLPGIFLNEEKQLTHLQQFSAYYKELPFTESKGRGRYYLNNDFFVYADGIVLYSFLRLLQPKRIIEIGSGYSTCVTLDVNELFLSGQLQISCIEPYPERLFSLIKEEDKQSFQLLQSNLEDVPLDFFDSLEAGDILFIDSTHVAKTGSDVNYYLFKLLPVLKRGVYIHIHDIFHPFEYPKSWVYEGRAWNEAYLLKAFLMYNKDYEIEFFNHYAGMKFEGRLKQEIPLFLKNTGSSLWLRKTG